MQIKLVNTKKYCLHAGLKKKPNNNKERPKTPNETNQPTTKPPDYNTRKYIYLNVILS